MIRKAFVTAFIYSVLVILAVVLWSVYRTQTTTLYEHASSKQAQAWYQPAPTPVKHTSKKIDLRKPPLILYWGYPWHDKSSGAPEGQKIGICDTTYDRSRIVEADAIAFHYTTIRAEDLPWKYYRNPKQLFVWWSAEGPSVLRLDGIKLGGYDGFFNWTWTWTYRRDADVARNYGYRGHVINSVAKGKKVVDELVAAKTALAVWIVSGCDYTHGARMRMKYVKEMQEAGLNFTGYGKCFERPVPRTKDFTYPHDTIKNYKFYLSFENALHCTDYITEKFWDNALRSGAVPVVWGPKKEDILRVAPLDSFIYVEDFKSPKDLVEYLLYLDKNSAEYRKFFSWREDESMTDEKMIKLTKTKYPNLDVQMSMKNFCDKLLENNHTKIISSLKKEFWDANPSECLMP
ncbi:4-galactosyl-N-acetylglucosaminide 3-alpha-L-fucosyltransferase FUT6-like [Clavelina lepadiformis]|uniref:4-galactosyl-N-acetylglucosaminide 3-alpha-L-fucosyltransferase FUT6-like n=1 Tax=Clavelina lepadiformis TaxID=159417 RepID=UPI0040432B57